MQFGKIHADDLGDHTIIFSDNENNILVTVTDSCGNSSECIALVTVIDDEDPMAECQNSTVELDVNGDATITPQQIDNGSNDDCGIAGLELDVTTFDCDDVGPNTVTLTVTDNNGNTSTCTAIVTVEDNVDPVAICQDITIQLDANGDASIIPADIDNGSNDACGIASRTIDVSTFNCSNVGITNTVTLTVTDVNGNSSICTSTVTVEDNVAPVAMCQNITVELLGNGIATIADDAVNNNSTDACGGLTFDTDITSFDCDDVGNPVTVVMTVTDANGNTNTCSAVVTVNGIIPIVTITESPLDEFCQGAVLVLTANSDEAAEYLWSPGDETTDSIEVSENGTYSVTVTSLTNCSTSASYTVTGYDAGSLVSSYTIIGTEEVDLHDGNLVQSGGVGVTTPGDEIRVRKASTIVEFAQASQIDIDNSSSVGVEIYQPANPILPPFVYNVYSDNSSPDVTINNGQTETLTGSVYDKIEVKDGATVIFMQPNVYIKELKTKQDANIDFVGCTNLFIKDKFILEKGGKINDDELNQVVIYVDNNVDIKENAKVYASIYARDHDIKVKGDKGNNSSPTLMTGLFIGKKVDGEKNVIWNASETCDSCPVEPPNDTPAEDTTDYTIIGFEDVHLHGDVDVVTGGVGVTRANKKIKVHDNSRIFDFAKSALLDLDNDSTVNLYIPEPANPVIPFFAHNYYSTSASPDVTINSGPPTTLSGEVYDKIDIKENATVIFTQQNVYIRELKTHKNVTIEFTGCTNLIIKKKFKLDENGTINPTGKKVVIYVDDKVDIKKGSFVEASIFAYRDDIRIDGDNNGNPTIMTGLFIGKKVNAHQNVIFNQDTAGAPCDVEPPSNYTPPPNEGSDVDKPGSIFEVKAWPNPTETVFNLKVLTENENDVDTVSIMVFDMSNKLVHQDTFNWNDEYAFGEKLDSGVYIVKITHGDQSDVLRLIKNAQ